MTELNRFPTLPPNGTGDARKVATAINGALKGKLNNALEVTLRASVTTTTIDSPLLGVASTLVFMPLTDNADIDVRVGPLYPSSQGTGTATLKHRSNAAVDRTLRVAVLG